MTDNGDGRPGLAYVTARHLYRSVVYTGVYLCGFAVVALGPTLYALGTPDSPLAGYLVLPLAGLALHTGQLQATRQLRDGEPERSRFVQASFTLFSWVYYNGLIVAAALAGVTLAPHAPAAAVAVAFLLPVADIEATRDYGVGLMALTARTAAALGASAERLYEDSATEEAVEGLTQFLSTPSDAVPPALRRLSVRSLAVGRSR